MGRKRTYAPLDVYMNRRKVGQYFRDPDGAFAFTYAPEWLAWENTLGSRFGGMRRCCATGGRWEARGCAAAMWRSCAP